MARSEREAPWDVEKERPDVAVLVALKEEFRSLAKEYAREWFPRRNPKHPGSDFLFLGPGGYRCVATIMPRMGPTVASTVSMRLLGWEPATIINVGIAGGFKDDLRIGDVIVPRQVDAYDETNKRKDGPKNPKSKSKEPLWERRSSSYRPTETIVADVQELDLVHDDAHAAWVEAGVAQLERVHSVKDRARVNALIEGKLLRSKPIISTNHLASGSSVVASKAFAEFIRATNADIHAGEMEAGGMMAAAAYQRDAVKTLVVRGISDHVDADKSEVDAIGGGALRRLAMDNAWRLVCTLMELDLLLRSSSQPGQRGGDGPDAGGESSKPLGEAMTRRNGGVDSRSAVAHQQVIVVGPTAMEDMNLEARSVGGGARERVELASPAVLPASQGYLADVGSTCARDEPTGRPGPDATVPPTPTEERPTAGAGPRSEWERRVVEIIAGKIDAEDGLLVWLGKESRWSAAAKDRSTDVAKALLAEDEPVAFIRGIREVMAALVLDGTHAAARVEVMNAVLFLALPFVAGRSKSPRQRAAGRSWSIKADYAITAETGMAHGDGRPMEVVEWRSGVDPTPRAYVTPDTPEGGVRLEQRVRDMRHALTKGMPVETHDLNAELAWGVLRASRTTIHTHQQRDRARIINRAKHRVNGARSGVEPSCLLTYYTLLVDENDRDLAEMLVDALEKNGLGGLRVLVSDIQARDRAEEDEIEYELEEVRAVYDRRQGSKP